MAIGHLSVRVGKVGKAQPHAAYIARQGQYSKRLTSERLEYTTASNMPVWAQHNPLQFWQAADAHERSNGSTYREFEIALPRELSPPQRQALVLEFVQQELGTHHPYQLAIHTPKAVDGQDQPHCHLMFCERKLDGIERDPEQFFKRYNAKHPERGGAKKENTGKDFTTRQTELKALRQRWETLCNTHLEQAGIESRIDMRSYQERQLDREPEPKQHPQRWKDPKQRAMILEFRAAQQEHAQAQQAVKSEIKDLSAELSNLRQPHKARAEQPWVKAKVEPPSPAHIQQVLSTLLKEAQSMLQTEKAQAQTQVEQASKALTEWEQRQPQVPTGLLSFLKQKDYQKNLARWQEHYNQLDRNKEQANTEYHKKRPSAERLAQQYLEQRYPLLAQEQKRLEALKWQQALEAEEAQKQAAVQAKLEKQEREATERKAWAEVLRSQNVEAIHQHPVLKETQRKIESVVKAGRDRADAIESHAQLIEKGSIRLDRGQSKALGR